MRVARIFGPIKQSWITFDIQLRTAPVPYGRKFCFEKHFEKTISKRMNYLQVQLVPCCLRINNESILVVMVLLIRSLQLTLSRANYPVNFKTVST